MTTEVRSKHADMFPEDLLRLNNEDGPGLHIMNSDGHASVRLDRTAFLDAVRSELGVLIIDGAQEPLDQWEAELVRAASDDDLTAENADALSVYFAWLAASKRAKPPVDEQQVEALVALLNKHDVYRSQDASIIARTLIRTGKVTVQS